MSIDFTALINQAAQEDDQSQTRTGGDYTAPKPGITVCRLVEYVELGMQKQNPYQGKPKPPAEEVRLTFELLSPVRDIHEFDGKRTADKISFRCKKSLSNKARFKRLFNQMDYGRGKTHMAHFLGEAFLVEVFNYKDSKGQVRASLFNEEGVCHIGAPLRAADPLDPAGKPTAIPVPDAISDLRLFLFNHPSPECWNSLYIEGEREVKDEKGVVTGKASKNFIQESIRSAVNFHGSTVEAMLAAISTPQVATSAENAAQADALAATPAVDPAKAAQAGRDALADMGF